MNRTPLRDWMAAHPDPDIGYRTIDAAHRDGIVTSHMPGVMSAGGVGTTYRVDLIESPAFAAPPMEALALDAPHPVGNLLVYAVHLSSGPVGGWLGAWRTWSDAAAWVVNVIRQEIEDETGGREASGPRYVPEVEA